MRQVLNLVKQMGPGWAAHRAAYSLKRQMGWFERRFPLSDWAQWSLERIAPDLATDRLEEFLHQQSQNFFISAKSRDRHKRRLKEILPERAVAKIIEEAERIRLGEFRFFSHRDVQCGWPPAWHLHPESGSEWPKLHWIKLDDFGERDVKWLWEIGRFGFAYTLTRAYWLTGDSAHAETFWQLVESFREENPPNCGAHWMCGQECAFRVMAWCFALFGMLDAEVTTDERVRMLVEILAAHGERIEGNLGFAILQKNNHAINEALALWTLGAVFPFLRAASRWEAGGREVLEREAARQIYGDGSYVQHSMNYHRLILQSYSWALRLGDLCGRGFSSNLRERFVRSTHFLYQLTDERSGRAPNYGSNDGATLFRLDSCDFSDYRPALALAFWVSEKKRVYPQGAWDEPLVWLCDEESFEQSSEQPVRTDLAAESGGYYTLRFRDRWGMIRCAEYRDRPAQADMLHVDLWWRGHNLVADPGTYSYNSPPPWNNGLSGTAAHNTVEVDSLDQMERGPRFTWFYWNRGKVIRRWTDETGRIKLVEGEHDGYGRRLSIIHRRALMLVDGRLWIIVDDIRGDGVHNLSTHWLFPETEVESRTEQLLRLRCPVGGFTVSFSAFASGARTNSSEIEIVKGSSDSIRGWFSDNYLHKESALSITAKDQSALPARRLTIIALADDVVIEEVGISGVKASFGTGRFVAEWRSLSSTAQDSIVERLTLE